MERLLRHIYENFYLKAMSLTRNNKEDAKDLIQDTCLKMIECFHRYEGLPFIEQQKISAFCMRNLFLDSIKRKNVRPKITIPIHEYWDEPGEFVDYAHRMLARKVDRFVFTNTDKHIQSAGLSAVGYTGDEIAKVYNTTRNSVQAFIRYGRSKIRKEFSDEI